MHTRATAHNAFKFTHVFGPEITQAEFFEQSVAPLCEDFVRGIHCCIFTYGQVRVFYVCMALYLSLSDFHDRRKLENRTLCSDRTVLNQMPAWLLALCIGSFTCYQLGRLYYYSYTSIDT